MDTTWTSFQNAYKTAPEATKKLIDSTTIPLCIEAELLSNNLPINFKKPLIKIYIDLRLGLQLREEAIEQMDSLGIPEAETFLAHVDLRIAQTKNHIDGIEAFEKEMTTASEQVTATQKLAASITETEAALQHLPSTRTMAGDAQVIKEHEAGGEPPVYQSTQPNLRPGNPLRGPGAPTWDD